MYLKNAASPPPIYAKVVAASDGSPIAAGVAAYHVQGSTRVPAAGPAAGHLAAGLWVYTPTQQETDHAAFAIEFSHAGAVGGGPVVEVATTDLAAIAALIDAALEAVVERTDRIPDSPAAVGSAMSLAAGERESLADAVLARGAAHSEADAAEHSLCTVILAILQSATSGGAWTIRRTDGATPHLVKQVTADPDAAPITGVS